MSAQVITVRLPGHAYDVRIEAGVLERSGVLLMPYARGERLVVVSDEIAWAAQGERLKRGLAAAGLSLALIVVPPGEGSKSWVQLERLIDRLAATGVERGDTIGAFGGGVVGDLAGFAAAVHMRGCGLVQMPTTLLAQVDSSVGGKTGINVAAGKNMVGAFHQPAFVLIDPDCLLTLPERQLRAGYAEVVKYGLIGDAGFFAWCEAHGAALIAGDAEARAHAVAISVAAKAAVVMADAHERGGTRLLLNLGHSFGHALEAATGFGDRLLHGEAVAIGMTLAYRLSAERGQCAAADAERVALHLASVGLPTMLPADVEDGAALTERMRRDKKVAGGALRLVLARGIGAAFVTDEVALGEVAAFLDRQPRR